MYVEGKKICVAFVIQSVGVGGREKTVIDLANGLDKKLFEVHLITFCKDNNSYAKKLHNDISFHTLSFRFKQLSGVNAIYFWITGLLSYIKLLRKIKPRIVHTHLFFQHFLFAAIGIRFSGKNIRHFHTVHTYGLFYTGKGILNATRLWIEKLAVRLNHAYIIAIAENVYDLCNKHFKKYAGDIKCIQNGVDEKIFDYHLSATEKKEAHGFDQENILVTYVARMDEGKDHITLLKAWKEIYHLKPQAKLLLAGDGILRLMLEKFVQTNGIADSVIFLNNVERVEKILAITDIGVFTSLFEGLSVAVIEKMFMKIPLVATNISMMEALIKNGDNGFLFQPGDEQALAMFLIKLIDDTDLRRTMGEKAYESVKDYSLTRTVQQHEAFYIHAIES